MFGMGNNDEEERFWNFALMNIYATDKEIEEMSPAIIIVLGIILISLLIGWGIYYLLH